MRALATVALTALMAACSEPADRPWTGTSQRISLTSFGMSQGLSGYDRQSSQLTAAQLDALAGLEVLEPLASCGLDLTSYELSIIDGAGVTRRYHANQTDQQCDSPDPFVAMASLRPFLDTFTCLSSRYAAEMPVALRPGDGCRHGVYMDGQGTSVRLKLEIAAAGELTIALEAGAGFVPHVTLLDLDGATELGTGAASLTFDFPAAGTYFVDVSSSSSTHGDLLLRVE